MQDSPGNWTTHFAGRLSKYIVHHHKEYWGSVDDIADQIKFVEQHTTFESFEEPPNKYYDNNERAIGIAKGILKKHCLLSRGGFRLYAIFIDCSNCPNTWINRCSDQKVLFFDLWATHELL